MFKFLTLKEQLQKEQRKSQALQAKLLAISKEVEVETEEGTQMVVEPLLKDETIKNTQDNKTIDGVLSDIIQLLIDKEVI